MEEKYLEKYNKLLSVNLEFFNKSRGYIKISNFDSTISIEAIDTKAGLKTISYNNKLLHSKYNPVREAEQWVKKLTVNLLPIVTVSGIGMGYHIAALASNNIKKIIIIEPNISLLIKVFCNQNFAALLKDYKTKFVLITKVEEVDEVIKSIIINDTDYTLFRQPVQEQILINSFKNLEEAVERWFEEKQIGLKTSIKMSLQWANRTLVNSPFILKHPPITELKNCFKNIPAVIVSPGPSLEKNLDFLKYIDNKVLKIALGQTQKVFEKAGIIPDFSIALESDDHVYQYSDTTEQTCPNLILSCIAHPDYYKVPSKRKFIYINKYDGLGRWFSEVKEISEYFQGSGTVSIAALQIAIHLGAYPIIMIGQNLCFEKLNDKYHMVYAKNSAKGFSLRNIILDKKSETYSYGGSPDKAFKLPGLFTEYVYTKQDYYTFFSGFEREIKKLKENTEAIIFNATEGGSLIRGAINIKLKEVLNKHAKSEIKVEPVITNKYKELDKNIISKKIESNWNNKLRALNQLWSVSAKCESLYKELSSDFKLTNQNENQLKKKFKRAEIFLRELYTYLDSNSVVDVLIQEELTNYRIKQQRAESLAEPDKTSKYLLNISELCSFIKNSCSGVKDMINRAKTLNS